MLGAPLHHACLVSVWHSCATGLQQQKVQDYCHPGQQHSDCIIASCVWRSCTTMAATGVTGASSRSGQQPSDCDMATLQGSVTPRRISREATLQLTVEMSTALTSETTARGLYRDTADATSATVELAGKAAAAAVEQYHSALRLQNMTGQVNKHTERFLPCSSSSSFFFLQFHVEVSCLHRGGFFCCMMVIPKQKKGLCDAHNLLVGPCWLCNQL